MGTVPLSFELVPSSAPFWRCDPGGFLLVTARPMKAKLWSKEGDVMRAVILIVFWWDGCSSPRECRSFCFRLWAWIGLERSGFLIRM